MFYFSQKKNKKAAASFCHKKKEQIRKKHQLQKQKFSPSIITD